MDASKLNDDNRIVALSAEEIDWVSGGKSVVPPAYMESFSNWLFGFGDFPGEPPMVNPAALASLQRATLDAGGTFYRNAAGLIAIMRADGEVATIET